jgi:monoamine oxidase
MPLFGVLRRVVDLARCANLPRSPAVGELIEIHRETPLSRREVLRGSVAAMGLGLINNEATRAAIQVQPDAPRIAIIGAGITGLNAAYELKKGGQRAVVYEAGTRTGGRIYTARDLLAPGLTADLGGEFIDRNHRTMLGLVRRFGLELIDLDRDRENAPLREAYFFDGAHHSEAQAVEVFRPLAARMEADRDCLEDDINFENGVNGCAGRIDRLSIAQYLDRIGAIGWIRKLIDVAYACEYGLDCDRLSALNLLSLISTDVSSGHFAIYGESDERYKIKGGSQQVTNALAAEVEGQIRLEYRLEAIQSAGNGYRLNFAVPDGQAVEVDADFVIITLPFSVLRQVALRVELPAVKRKAIAELGYGTNAKLLAGVHKRRWRERGFSGSIFSDEPFQSAFDNSRFQGGEAGGLTLFSGGKAGLDVGGGTEAEQIQSLIGGVDRAFPGVAAALNGKSARFHWPSNPFALGSYACYTPGQWTTIAGCEGLPVGNLFFAGEHCNFDFSGYMDSGAATGRRAARGVLARIRRG